MAQDVAALQRLADQPIVVEPGSIESAFAHIWQESANDGADESAVLLRVLNFVGVGPELWTVERFERVMESFPRHHACRAILAVVAAEQQGIEASISAHCWFVGGRRHTCSEEVILRGGPGDARSLASTILGLLVPELPVAVWAIGEIDMKDDAVARILEAADSVYVDSADTLDPAQGLRDALAASDSHGVQVCDLAWRRLSGWRALVAQFFDGEDGLKRLSALQSIDITSGGSRPSSEAMLIAGWLISRLGLSLADLDTHRAELSATLYDVSRAVSLRVVADAKSPLPLTEVRLRISDADLIVQMHESSAHMHVRFEPIGGSPDHRTVAPIDTDDASILAGAIDDHSDGPVFLDALRASVSLLGEE